MGGGEAGERAAEVEESQVRNRWRSKLWLGSKARENQAAEARTRDRKEAATAAALRPWRRWRLEKRREGRGEAVGRVGFVVTVDAVIAGGKVHFLAGGASWLRRSVGTDHRK